MRRNTPLETITAIIFMFFVGLLLYYSFWPFKVTTFRSISVDSAEYCRGDWADVKLDFQKHMDVTAEVKWYIVDGVIYQLDSPGISRPVGDNSFLVSKQIPLSILPGKYHFRVESTYHVHPLHQPIVIGWDSPTFTILGNDKCPTSNGEPHSNDN